jgi:heterotetrameric sarcosine oxidase gamma subunit
VSGFAPVRVSAMYRAQVALRARFRTADGWTVAEAFTSPEDEARGAGATVGLVDVSAGTRVGIRGEEAAALLAKLIGQPAPGPGEAVRARLNGTGVLVCRLASDEALVLAGTAAEMVSDLLADSAGAVSCAHVTDLTAAFAVLEIVGPRARALLEKLVPLDLAPGATVPLTVLQTELSHVRAILIRLDHALPAYWLLVPRECGEFVWDVVRGAGHDLDLVLVGATAHARLAGEAQRTDP